MPDTTVTKVNSKYSPVGEMGQRYLATGKHISMRKWDEQPTQGDVESSVRDYETVGYVISGKAELEIENQTVLLEEGDSWVVPKGSRHRYRILEHFVAVEATTPVAEVKGRDEPPRVH